jgi:CHAT domain-containing protein
MELAHARPRVAVSSAVRVTGAVVAVAWTVLSPTFGQEPEARELQRRAAASVRSFRESVRKGGPKSLRADDLLRAVRDLDEAHRTFLAAGNAGDAAACRVEAADVLRLQGKLADALEAYAEGEALARKAGASALLARVLVAQGRTRLYGVKDIEGARPFAAGALRASSSIPDRGLLLDALCLQCEVDLGRGELFSASDWISRAMALRPQVRDEALLFYALHDRAAVGVQFAKLFESRSAHEVCLERMELALRDAIEARDLAQKLGWDFIASQADQVRRSTQLLYWSMNMEKQKRDRDQRLPSSNPSSPRDVLVTEEFVSPQGEPLPPPLTAMVQKWAEADPGDAVRSYARAQVAQISGHGDEALAGYLRAIELLERDYRALQDIEARGTLLSPKIDFYYWPMLHLLQRKKLPEAFRLLEAWRSRTLADLLTTRAAVDLADEQERQMYGRLRDLRARLATADGQRPGEMGRLAAEHGALLQEIRAKAPGILQLLSAETPPLAAVQQSAARGGYDVLEYVVLDSQVVVWHIGASGVHVRSIVFARDILNQKLEALRATLTDPKAAFESRTARQLFLVLLDPVLAHVTTDHLVVVPHDQLYHVPFEAFQDTAGRFVGDRFRVSYAPGAGVLQRLEASGHLAGSATLAVAGPHLDEALPEALDLVRLYPHGSKAVPERSATATYIRRNAGGYDILHVAAHARFDPKEPLLSYVALTPADGDDGRWSAAAMFALPLGRTKLVTLSACETGRISDARTGEVMGMPRALLYAGARAVLLTRWKIDSPATRTWMRAFYREAARSSCSEAARQAGAELRARPEYAHPYYWAGFYLVGR